MKKFAPLLVAACCISPAAFAADISTLNLLSQSEFRDLSEDLGAALSYKSVQPAEPLGVTGFDMGVAVTGTDVSKSSAALSKASGSSSQINTLYLPKLQLAKGLPFGIDVAASFAVVPTTNIRVVGAELRYALMEGGVALPAVAIRGSISSLSGVDQLSFSTKALDISISKGFAMFTPYAGIGQVWVKSTPNAGTLAEESFALGKAFVGLNVNLGLTNIALEADKTGGAQSYTAKLGFRF